jgi:hypothetical protein
MCKPLAFIWSTVHSVDSCSGSKFHSSSFLVVLLMHAYPEHHCSLVILVIIVVVMVLVLVLLRDGARVASRSVFFLLRNLYPVLNATDAKASKILLILVVVLHAVIIVVVMVLVLVLLRDGARVASRYVSKGQFV